MNIYECDGVYSGSNLFFFATRDTIWGLMDCSQIAVNSPFPAWLWFNLTHTKVLFFYDRGTDLFSSPSVRICVLLRHILINTSLFCGWKLELWYCILPELNMQ